MESAPEDFNYDAMVQAVKEIEGVYDVHHVHLWRLDKERVALEAHVSVAERDLRQIEEIKRRIKERLREDFGVEHTTLEVELQDRIEHDRSTIREGE